MAKHTGVAQIHVNRHVIAFNRKHRTYLPVFTVKHHGMNEYAHAVEIKGPSRMVYQPDCPLACGAVAWIEADVRDVEMVEPTTWSDMRGQMVMYGEVMEEARL